jgi:hypothetical protein
MRKKILLHLIATGKYDRYLGGIIDSARTNFFPDEYLEIVIYTDSEKFLELLDSKIHCVKIDHEPWPNPTLKRFHYFDMAAGLIGQSDFSFYIDVDSMFVKKLDFESIGLDENLRGMIGTLHPGYYGCNGTPERRPSSTAYIPYGSNNLYYCGGFFGGSSREFLKTIKLIEESIQKDLENGIIAIWHDESHLNKFFFHNPPGFTLGRGLACPEERMFIDPEFMEPAIAFLNKEDHIKMEKRQDVN